MKAKTLLLYVSILSFYGLTFQAELSRAESPFGKLINYLYPEKKVYRDVDFSSSNRPLDTYGERTCYIDSNSDVKCTEHEAVIDDIKGPFISVGVGLKHACALYQTGKVHCWGDNAARQSEQQTDSFAALAVGGKHTCGLTHGGKIKCWGDNFFQQSQDRPTKFYREITAGIWHTCGLTLSGDIECWGYRTEFYTDSMTDVNTIHGPFIKMATSEKQTCGLKADGKVICAVGRNSAQMQDGKGIFDLIERRFGHGDKHRIVSIAVADCHICALSSEGKLLCTGNHENNEVAEPMEGRFTNIALDGPRTCAMEYNGEMRCLDSWHPRSEAEDHLSHPYHGHFDHDHSRSPSY